MPVYHILLTCKLFYIGFFPKCNVLQNCKRQQRFTSAVGINFMAIVIVWINAVDLIYFYMNCVTFVPF